MDPRFVETFLANKDKEIGHAGYIEPHLRPASSAKDPHAPIAGKFST